MSSGSRATNAEGWRWASPFLPVLVFISLPFLFSSGDCGFLSVMTQEVGRCSKMALPAVLTSDGHCFPALICGHPLPSIHSGHRPGYKKCLWARWPHRVGNSRTGPERNHQFLPRCLCQGVGPEGWSQSGKPERGKFSRQSLLPPLYNIWPCFILFSITKIILVHCQHLNNIKVDRERNPCTTPSSPQHKTYLSLAYIFFVPLLYICKHILGLFLK